MGLEAVLPGPQNALYVMLCYVKAHTSLEKTSAPLAVQIPN